MLFLNNLVKQANVIAMAAIALMAFAWLPIYANGETILHCYQKANANDPCGGDSAYGTGNVHGVNVVPYCYALKLEYPTNKICADVRCETCRGISGYNGTCAYFAPQHPIRCIVLD